METAAAQPPRTRGAEEAAEEARSGEAAEAVEATEAAEAAEAPEPKSALSPRALQAHPPAMQAHPPVMAAAPAAPAAAPARPSSLMDRVRRIRAELSLPDGPLLMMLREAHLALDLTPSGGVVQQTDRLLRELFGD